MAGFNKTLGKFQLVGIPPAPRGVPQVEVTFDIDANGILSVSAKDLGTGNEQKIEVRSGSGLADDEIERMVKDAEAHADDDKRLRELADAKNQAETAIYSVEKSLREHGDKVDEGTSRRTIETAAAELRTALEGDDAEAIRTRTQALHEASYKLAEVVYQNTGASGGSAERGGTPPERRGRGRGHRGRRDRGRGRPRAVVTHDTPITRHPDEAAVAGAGDQPAPAPGPEAAADPSRTGSRSSSASATSTSITCDGWRPTSTTTRSARRGSPSSRPRRPARASCARSCRCSTISSARSTSSPRRASTSRCAAAWR